MFFLSYCFQFSCNGSCFYERSWAHISNSLANVQSPPSLITALMHFLIKLITELCLFINFLDKEYRDLYEKTEKARLEWEASMLKCCQVKYVLRNCKWNVLLFTFQARTFKYFKTFFVITEGFLVR